MIKAGSLKIENKREKIVFTVGSWLVGSLEAIINQLKSHLKNE